MMMMMVNIREGEYYADIDAQVLDANEGVLSAFKARNWNVGDDFGDTRTLHKGCDWLWVVRLNKEMQLELFLNVIKFENQNI